MVARVSKVGSDVHGYGFPNFSQSVRLFQLFWSKVLYAHYKIEAQNVGASKVSIILPSRFPSVRPKVGTRKFVNRPKKLAIL